MVFPPISSVPGGAVFNGTSEQIDYEKAENPTLKNSVDRLSNSSQENLSTSGSSHGEAVEEDAWVPMPARGILSKWTNLLHGWQERYFVLSNGYLTYYRNEEDVDFGSRGSVRIGNAFIKLHDYDECRFEVRVGEVIWYLRGVSLSQRQEWVAAIERHQLAEPGHNTSEKMLRRPSSLVSLNSVRSQSVCSNSSLKPGQRLREKLAEMETFKDILCKQVDTLQAHFDSCAALTSKSSEDHFDECYKPEQNSSEDLAYTDTDRTDVRGGSKYAGSRSEEASTGTYNSATEMATRNGVRSSSKNPLSQSIRNVPSSDSADIESESGLGTSTQSTNHGSPSRSTRELESNRSSAGLLSRLFASIRNAPMTEPEIGDCVEGDQSPLDPIKNGVSSDPFHSLNVGHIIKQHGTWAPNFRAQSHMFKATSAGIISNLSHTIDLMLQHEDKWQKRTNSDADKRRRLEETHRAMAQEILQLRRLLGMNPGSNVLPSTYSYPNSVSMPSGHVRLKSCGQIDFRHTTTTDGMTDGRQKLIPQNRLLFDMAGPDFAEGPNSPIREEEFYDAIDAESDKIEEDAARLAALRCVGKLLRSATAMPTSHPLHNDLEQSVSERIRNYANPEAFLPPGQRATECVGDADSAVPLDDWKVIAQEGEMIIYQRELETEDHVVLDPLQAVHTVDGVTAREMCTHFWDVQYRMDWEFTVDRAPTVLEVCGDDTVVLHQVYKRIWPTTQRDSLFWSHIRQVTPFTTSHPDGPFSSEPTTTTTTSRPDSSSNHPADRVLDSWMVVNMSTDYLADDVPSSSTPTIRLGLDVILFCQTILVGSSVQSPPIGEDVIPRERIRTRLVYVANVNPNGWVPATGLRALARREYPRFLRRFSAYVQEQTRDALPSF